MLYEIFKRSYMIYLGLSLAFTHGSNLSYLFGPNAHKKEELLPIINF